MGGADSIVLNARESAALRMIAQAAERGEVCPSNALIAAAAGYNSMSVGSDIVARLEQLGAISVTRTRRTRVVTVTATGERTRDVCEPRGYTLRRDRLAELVADGLTLTEAAERLGLKRGAAGHIWARIRADLGAQAV